MPKVSDYELEHLDDEQFEQKKQKKTKQPKEKKYSEKVDHRKNWKRNKKAEQSFEDELETKQEEIDLESEE